MNTTLLRQRLRAAGEALLGDEKPSAAMVAQEGGGLRAVHSPLDGLAQLTRSRLKECAQEMDCTEMAALALAVRELHTKLRFE